jgi:acyl-CoA dehydrogenase
MQFGLSHEQEMIVSTVCDFVETEMYPHEAAGEASGKVTPVLAEKIKQ